MLIGIDASRATVAHRTGTEAYSLRLIQALLAIKDEDRPSPHHFRLYLNRAPQANLFPSEPTIEERVIPFPRLWTHLRLAAELSSRRPDVLYVPSHVLPFAFPGPAAVTVHDLGYRVFPWAHPALNRLYLDWSTRWNARRASVVIADSEATRRDLIDQYQTDPGKIVVAYPGYDEDLHPVHDPARLTALRKRYGFPDPLAGCPGEGAYLLYLGTLQPRKNLIRLIDAYTRAVDSPGSPSPEPGPLLVLAGSPGWLAGPILEYARQAGPTVHITGFIAEEDKAALISGATAFLFPSLYEGFGFPVLEAMACGTPVICSNTSSLPQVAGDAALLVDPLDTAGLATAIRHVLTDESLRSGLTRRGFANLQRFSWQRCARQVLAAIESIA
ncbi:MAG: glycosyltransferase [Ardenticatenales bacterium]|nr:glycosyltransferase [Ardenticatenales bacterium]